MVTQKKRNVSFSASTNDLFLSTSPKKGETVKCCVQNKVMNSCVIELQFAFVVVDWSKYKKAQEQQRFSFSKRGKQTKWSLLCLIVSYYHELILWICHLTSCFSIAQSRKSALRLEVFLSFVIFCSVPLKSFRSSSVPSFPSSSCRFWRSFSSFRGFSLVRSWALFWFSSIWRGFPNRTTNTQHKLVRWNWLNKPKFSVVGMGRREEKRRTHQR